MNQLTSAFLRYPLSVFNKNSTLKRRKDLTRTWRTDRTCAVTRRRTGLIHLSQYLRHWFPARDNQSSGPPYKTFFSLQSLRWTSQDMRMEKHSKYPSYAQRTSLRAQPGQSTESIQSSKVKSPNPTLHLIQHHLALLHASSRSNDCIGSLDLLDSGG